LFGAVREFLKLRIVDAGNFGFGFQIDLRD
jgi:hypothetical protein